MTLITIREQGQTAEGFQAELVFENGGRYSIAISNPLEPQQERELEWYFEGWIRRPYQDEAIAARAAKSIEDCGQVLFEQVFKADFDAFAEYRDLRGNLGETRWVIESKTPEFQALHWEALRDPDLPRPISVAASMTRRLVKPVAVKAKVKESPVIN
ncbi:MAG: Tfp pilus assembly protein PilF, partial [Cyanobacteria bacterium P01_F01_bin.42]